MTTAKRTVNRTELCERYAKLAASHDAAIAALRALISNAKW